MSTLNIHHLGLAVRDLDTSTAFFTEILGFKVVREKPDYPAKFISNGQCVLTLWQTDAGAADFNRRSAVGLHHFALRVDSEASLRELYQQALGVSGVSADFAPEPLGDSGAMHTIFYEPGGIRIELIWTGES
ncbi:MAG: VOC family protein [Pseudomonadota bacterium]|nr:VOC family protein [Pseudomonadota bacterium]